uniref:Aminotransferase-like plant mobile domain-containing protein n=1 Tax=Fagus sylvatica TaxID=28930 RepID=A0A2N9IP15_FAGSY
MHPGPLVPSVLTRQYCHRSTAIWNGSLVEQLLHCRRRSKVLLRGPQPHPRVVSYIQRAGLYGLYALGFIRIDWALITALVERWRRETHTFHMPHGEMTITLQDVEVLLGLPVDGRPLVASPIVEPAELCRQLLGVTTTEEALDGSRISLPWLSRQFQAPITAETNEQTVQQYARFYMLSLLGGNIFVDKSNNKVHVVWLQFLEDFDRAREYSWGGAALAWMYRELCRACEMPAKDIAGPLILVQMWAWERFPHMVPELVAPPEIDYGEDVDGQPLPRGPHGVRWRGIKCKKKVPTHVLESYRRSFSTILASQIIWEPYKEILDGLPAYCKAGQDIWRTKSPLVCGHLIEWHLPNRVLRQFGMEQDIPGPFDTETRLHDVDLRGKSDTDWTIEWADYIQKWNTRAETVVTRPLLEQPISYSHPYMRWYRHITRRCISKDSSQYDELADILVSHITTCPSETPGSGLHRGLEILNSLNRLAPATLDDASTSAPVNPPDDVDGTLHGSPFPGGRCRGAPRGRGASHGDGRPRGASRGGGRARGAPRGGGRARGAPRGGGRARGAPRGGGHARDEDGIRTAPPLTVGTDLEDHPAAPESTPATSIHPAAPESTPATPIHPAAPESTPATSSHPMDINMSECVAPIEPSTEFGSIATPSVPIAHVEMTSTGPNQTCSPPSSSLPTTLEEPPLAVDLVGQVDGLVWGKRRQRRPEQTEAPQVDYLQQPSQLDHPQQPQRRILPKRIKKLRPCGT